MHATRITTAPSCCIAPASFTARSVAALRMGAYEGCRVRLEVCASSVMEAGSARRAERLRERLHRRLVRIGLRGRADGFYEPRAVGLLLLDGGGEHVLLLAAQAHRRALEAGVLEGLNDGRQLFFGDRL